MTGASAGGIHPLQRGKGCIHLLQRSFYMLAHSNAAADKRGAQPLVFLLPGGGVLLLVISRALAQIGELQAGASDPLLLLSRRFRFRLIPPSPRTFQEGPGTTVLKRNQLFGFGVNGGAGAQFPYQLLKAGDVGFEMPASLSRNTTPGSRRSAPAHPPRGSRAAWPAGRRAERRIPRPAPGCPVQKSR